jgi:putative sigma-54 modulation protein
VYTAPALQKDPDGHSGRLPHSWKEMAHVNIEITGRHFEVTPPMEKHIRQHIDKLPRLDDHIQYLTVTLNVESDRQRCEVQAKVHRSDLFADAVSHDMYESIDNAFSKIERQIRQLHDKIVSKRARAAQQAAENNRRPE